MNKAPVRGVETSFSYSFVVGVPILLFMVSLADQTDFRRNLDVNKTIRNQRLSKAYSVCCRSAMYTRRSNCTFATFFYQKIYLLNLILQNTDASENPESGFLDAAVPILDSGEM